MSEPIEPSPDESNRLLALIDAALNRVSSHRSSRQRSELELRAGSDPSDGQLGG